MENHGFRYYDGTIEMIRLQWSLACRWFYQVSNSGNLYWFMHINLLMNQINIQKCRRSRTISCHRSIFSHEPVFDIFTEPFFFRRLLRITTVDIKIPLALDLHGIKRRKREKGRCMKAVTDRHKRRNFSVFNKSNKQANKRSHRIPLIATKSDL